MSSQQQQPLLVPSQLQLDTFAKGLLATLALWSAYQIALKECARTDEKPQETTLRLATELLDAFLAPYSITGNPRMPEQSDLAEFLHEFVDVELETVLEDDSERAIVRDISALWKLCCLEVKDTLTPQAKETVEKLVALAEQRKGVKIQITRDLAESDSESGTESDGENTMDVDAAADMEIDDSQASSKQHSQDRDSGYASASPVRATFKPEPIVDDDGFTTVQHAKRGQR